MLTKQIKETCKCCNGDGVQKRADGIMLRCPECNGSGEWIKKEANSWTLTNVPPYEAWPTNPVREKDFTLSK